VGQKRVLVAGAARSEKRGRKRLTLYGAAALALAMSAAPAWADLPLPPARTLTIQATRGTWMSPDLSPDGATILFDMLGDLYTMPATGGTARQITHGLAYDSQPVFSPDGGWIAYVSDGSGAENLWLARPDGSQAHALTTATGEAVLTSPAWRADGKALFVSRYYADRNNYELVEIALDGRETMIDPIRTAPGQERAAWHSTLGATSSRDGRWLYLARNIGGVNFDEVDHWAILRRDLADGHEEMVIGGPAQRGLPRETVFRPALSPDGRLLAYATRRLSETTLRLRDLASGRDELLATLDPDQLESSGWQDLVPRFVFTPDGRGLLITRGGRFERIDIASHAATPLPFTASMAVDVGPSTRVSTREETGPVKARLIQAPVLSPDGRSIAFSALGQLYLQPARPGGTPRKIVTGTPGAWQPSFSPDGRTLVFVSWSEKEGGTIWAVPVDGSAPARALSTLPAFYTSPAFTPDGRQVLALRSPMAARRDNIFEVTRLRHAQLVAVPAQGGEARVIAEGMLGARPHFTREAGKTCLLTDEGLKSFDLASGAAQVIAQVKGPGYYFAEGSAAVDDLAISPDGRHLLAQVAQQLYLLPLPKDHQPVDVSQPQSSSIRITRRGADFFGWSDDGALVWSVGSTLRHLPLAKAASGAETRAVAIAMPVFASRDIAQGRLLLRGGRVLTMAAGDRIIPDADVLIEHGRIARIGARGSFALPPGTTIRDVTGKTILPGFIDEHDHIAEIHREVLSTEDWGLRARLAWGITTSFDPSTLSIDMLAYQDLLDSGAMLGPRLRSTGPALFSFNRFTALDEVRDVLRRYREDYGLTNLKEYRTGNRQVRQWVAMAARELGLQPTTEGALSLKLDLTQMLDGYAGNEHALPTAVMGDDVLGLMTAMRTSYATTMMVTHSAPDGADWYITREDPAADPKIRHFWTPSAISQKLTGRAWHPLEDYRFGIVGATAADLARAGGLVGMGAHGEVPGVGFHWEMEAHTLGGMAPMAVLHAATAGSAETIGRLADLGTLEPGKIADLVVLDADPLVDIRNTRRIAAVMRDGRLYAGATLDTLWPDPHPAAAAWFHGITGPEQWLPAQAGKRGR
jgi:Tol biopolymer transport system component